MVQKLALRYGSMEHPDEQRRPAERENPLEVARAAHSLWKQVCTPKDEVLDANYAEAAALLAPHAKAFRNVGPERLDGFIMELDKHPDRCNGLFVSALLNETELPALSGIFRDYQHIGYRLKPGKVLVIKDGSTVLNAALHASGGTVVNRGMCYSLGADSQGAAFLNLNVAVKIGRGTADCLLVNAGNFPEQVGHAQLTADLRNADPNPLHDFFEDYTLAFSALNSVSINLGFEYMTAFSVIGGLHINYHTSHFYYPTPFFYSRGSKRIQGTLISAGQSHVPPQPFSDSVSHGTGFQKKVIWPEGGVVYEALTDSPGVYKDPAVSLIKKRAEEVVNMVLGLERGSDFSLRVAAYDWAGFRAETMAEARELEKRLGAGAS